MAALSSAKPETRAARVQVALRAVIALALLGLAAHAHLTAQTPQPLTVTLRNATEAPLDLYWVADDGNNQTYLSAPVPAGQDAPFQSYPGTHWRAYRGAAFLQEYVVTDAADQVFLVGGASTPPPPPPPSGSAANAPSGPASAAGAAAPPEPRRRSSHRT